MSQIINKRGIMVLLLIFSVLIISGCQNSPTSEEGNIYFRSGSKGLEMRFIQDMPPHTIYEGDILPIGLELFNRGTAPIYEGQIYITGYDPAIIHNVGPFLTGDLPLYGTPLTFNVLDYKDQYNQEGGYQNIERYSNQIILPPGTDIYKVPLTIYACYDYETIASGSICIDPQPHRISRDKPCVTNSVSMGGTQGAPVAVTHLEVKNLRNEVRLIFSVSNVGGGTLLDIGTYRAKCPTQFTPNDFNKVDLDYVRVGNTDITGNCQPSVNPITLYNGNGKIICTYPMMGDTAYTTPVEIGLVYGYRDYIYKNIQVKNVD